MFKFALTLGFFPSTVINGGLSKGFTTGSSVTSSTISLEINDLLSSSGGGLGLDSGFGVGLLLALCLRSVLTLGLALKGLRVVVKPRRTGLGVVTRVLASSS